MDVRDQRQRRFFRNAPEALSRLHIRDGKTGDLAACLLQRGKLCEAALHVGGRRIEHRLDGNRRASADLHSAD